VTAHPPLTPQALPRRPPGPAAPARAAGEGLGHGRVDGDLNRVEGPAVSVSVKPALPRLWHAGHSRLLPLRRAFVADPAPIRRAGHDAGRPSAVLRLDEAQAPILTEQRSPDAVPRPATRAGRRGAGLGQVPGRVRTGVRGADASMASGVATPDPVRLAGHVAPRGTTERRAFTAPSRSVTARATATPRAPGARRPQAAGPG
jgi:5-methylthioribose kinase